MYGLDSGTLGWESLKSSRRNMSVLEMDSEHKMPIATATYLRLLLH